MAIRLSTAATLPAAALGLVLAWSGVQAAVGLDELSDAAARIQYAVYERDFRSLDRLSETLSDERARGGLTALVRYQAAYAAYRAGELAPEQGVADTPYLERCQEQALAAVHEDPAFADAWALAGACAALDASRNLTALMSARRARQHLRNALELAPENPRVLLLTAVTVIRQPSLKDAWGEAGDLLARTRQRFATTLPPERGRPDWGEAETALLEAELALADGRVLDARDAVERALMFAPDYRRARTLIEKLSASAR